MNTLKPLLVIAILGGIGYGAYTRINSGPVNPPPGMPEGWDAAPNVQMASPSPPGSATPWGPSAPPATAGMAGSFVPPGMAGPPAADPNAGAAPPYQSPVAPTLGATSFDATATTGAPVQPAGTPPASTPSIYEQQPAVNPAAVPAGTAMPPAAAMVTPQTQLPGGAPLAGPPAGQYAASIPDALRTPAAAAPAVDPSTAFATALEAARRELDAGHMAEAHRELSAWYEDPRLSPMEQQQLTELLDQVAGTVIYSTQSLLEAPHEVQPGEKLEDIGKQYSVPWQLLAKINGIEDPNSLRPGERLKILRGPFGAVVNLDKHVLTVTLNGLYAGRFGIGLGRDHPVAEGQFTVTDKVTNPTYRGLERAIEADDPNNPLGERWISLDDKMGIHGSTDPAAVGRNDLPGSISMAPRDVEDVFDILSVGSKVVVRR